MLFQKASVKLQSARRWEEVFGWQKQRWQVGLQGQFFRRILSAIKALLCKTIQAKNLHLGWVLAY
jgi:hypothetical protein